MFSLFSISGCSPLSQSPGPVHSAGDVQSMSFSPCSGLWLFSLALIFTIKTLTKSRSGHVGNFFSAFSHTLRVNLFWRKICKFRERQKEINSLLVRGNQLLFYYFYFGYFIISINVYNCSVQTNESWVSQCVLLNNYCEHFPICSLIFNNIILGQ